MPDHAPDDHSRQTFAIDDAVALLSRTPATLDVLLRGLPAAWIAANEGPDTWTPFDVIGHLIHADRTNWLPRARLILEHGETQPFTDFDRFAQRAASAGRTLSELLDEFAAVRGACLGGLAALDLTAGDLDRCGRHPALGAVTLRQLLASWVTHDLDHVVQVTRVLARQYTDAVGPWREYLRVVRETPG